ncbi:MAG: hypothetical protein GXP33_15465 [Spirochaetes bacterium]|nr:hypothetical protein [Spirochaetota bacterium]
MEDTDLNGLDYQSAKEYVLLYITTLKKTDREIGKALSELRKWENRVKLASEKGKDDLKEIAGQKAREAKETVKALNAERDELIVKVEQLKRNLLRVKAGPEYSVDADKLLAEFQMLLGEEDTTGKGIKELEIDKSLDTLKEKLHKKPQT